MKILSRFFGLDRILGLGLLVGLVLLKWSDPYPVEFLRLKVFDYYQQVKPREIPPPEKKPVTIIDIDERSLAEVGQWPWPRSTIAKLVENTKQMGATLIAFDIVFAEPDRTDPQTIIKAVKGLDEETVNKIKALPSNDTILGKTVSQFAEKKYFNN